LALTVDRHTQRTDPGGAVKAGPADEQRRSASHGKGAWQRRVETDA